MDKRRGEREKRRKGEEEKGRQLNNSSSEASSFEISDLETNKIFSSSLLLFSLAFLHLVIALPLAFLLNIWSDEASTLYTTENGLWQTFQRAFADEKQAPLYFWMLSVWREISASIFFARLFSVICSLLAIKFFYEITRKFFDKKTALFATAFFALHPFLFWASLEIRVYSLVILLSAVFLKFFAEAYLEPPTKAQNSPNRAQIYLVLTSIIALYTNYYFGFLLVGCLAALIVSGKWREAKSYFLKMLMVGTAILPLFWMISRQFAAGLNNFQKDSDFLTGVRMLWNSFLTFVLPTEIFTPDDISAVSEVRLWLVRLAILAVVVWHIKKRRRPDEKILVFGTISAVVFGFLLLAYFLIGEIYVEVRHAAVVFVPVILLGTSVLHEILMPERQTAGTLGKKLRMISAVFLFALVILSFSYSLLTLYPNLAKRGDWARVAAFIQQNEQPQQPIIVFTTYDALNLPYYYRGENKILPDENFFKWGMENESGLKSEIEFVISKIPPDAEEIWLARDARCLKTKACEPLKNFIEANYTIIREEEFYKTQVFLLRKKTR